MSKKVALLLEDLYNEQEFWYPYYRMIEAGYEVTVIGTGRKSSYEGKSGLSAKEDVAAKDVDPKDFDAVIVPGGFAPDYMRRDNDMVNLVKVISDQGGVVAAICHALWVLASADILKGKKATAAASIKVDVINAGGTFLDEVVVVDGNLVTSRKPDDLPAFCKEIIGKLEE
ncbi:type 1 glutamine amidotransferase domain-containing protein [Proteinivorax tanatarense]|uniref:Type 1 glutamine amidotransferase domain-containing protein n=1 Tax=Proteinivorax tanatarense TaxID=1260629 RepID=A0AAU7VMU2_9FIRM